MRVKLVFSCLLLLLLGNLSAQSYFNVLNLNTSNSPQNHYYDQDASLDIQNMGLSVQVPFNLDSNNLVLVGVTGNKTDFIYTSNKLQNSTTRLSAIGLQLGWQKTLAPGKQRLIMLIPSIKSDFKDVGSNDYQLGFAVLYTKKVNGQLKIKYGLYANQHNFGPFIAPIFGLDYKMKNNWRLFGTLPSYLTLEKKHNTNFRSGLDLRISTNTYRFSESIGNPYLQQNLNTLSGFIEIYPQKLFALRFSAGHSIFRSYRAYAQDELLDLSILGIGIGEKRKELRSNEFGEVKNGLVFELSLFIRVEID